MWRRCRRIGVGLEPRNIVRVALIFPLELNCVLSSRETYFENPQDVVSGIQ